MLPEDLTHIGASAFENCEKLSDISLPNSLTSIEQNAFSGCISLESITLPEGLTLIGPSAFNNCSNLFKITLPSTLEYIGRNAFHGCFRLEQVNYSSTASQKTQIISDEGTTFLFNKVWKLTPINFLGAILKTILPAFYFEFVLHIIIIIVCFILERKQRTRQFYR